MRALNVEYLKRTVTNKIMSSFRNRIVNNQYQPIKYRAALFLKHLFCYLKKSKSFKTKLIFYFNVD